METSRLMMMMGVRFYRRGMRSEEDWKLWMMCKSYEFQY